MMAVTFPPGLAGRAEACLWGAWVPYLGPWQRWSERQKQDLIRVEEERKMKEGKRRRRHRDSWQACEHRRQSAAGSRHRAEPAVPSSLQ